MGGIPGLDKLVERVFDYAGMFPPASKPLEDALAASARFPTSLLRPRIVASDIVLAMSDIQGLTGKHLTDAGFERGREVSIVALGSPIDADQLSQAFVTARGELASIAEINRQRSLAAIPQYVGAYEVKISIPLADAEGYWSAIRHALETELPSGVSVCLEPDLSLDDWRDALALYVRLISESPSPGLALKVRGSGPVGIGTEKLAAVIEEVCARGVQFKATAGLHHPLIESERYGNNLGFVGLLAAHYLRRLQRIGEADVRQCLEEADPAAFDFSSGLRWRDATMTLSEMARMKAAYPLLIGSCSLEEPDADLERLFGRG